MSAPVVSASSAGPPRVPLLNNGDHLTRVEFERRYDAMPNLKKAELIEGVVYMPSPVRTDLHGQPHALVMIWLGTYYTTTPGLLISDNGSVRLDDKNEPQPDVSLLIDKSRGGQAGLDADGYIDGAPELVVEVAASSVSIDRNAKLRAYQRTGVREYIIWRTEDGEIDWFILRGGRYETLTPGPDGVFRSEVFPGLWLASAALVSQEMASVLAVLQQGLATLEHAAFVASLDPTPEPRTK